MTVNYVMTEDAHFYVRSSQHMPTQINKLEAHASHLLDAFINLKERYSLLHPMLFDEAVVLHHGSSGRARGFQTLRYSLFLSCAQDIAKLTHDTEQATSIKKLVQDLGNLRIQTELQERYSAWALPYIKNEHDLAIRDALQRLELNETEKRREQFSGILSRVDSNFAALKHDPALEGFRTIRDKISAHTEVRFFEDKYQFVDISKLGIKWSDLKRIIALMQSLIEDLGMLIRNASFDWESLDLQLSRSSEEFWRPGAI